MITSQRVCDSFPELGSKKGLCVLPDTMLKHLRAMDAMKNFSEFRQEASMLHSLQHPCIVSLIGISIHPLCFALELAPLGSLTTVLAENSKGEASLSLTPLPLTNAQWCLNYCLICWRGFFFFSRRREVGGMELFLYCAFGNLVKIDARDSQSCFGDLDFQFLCKLIWSASLFGAEWMVLCFSPCRWVSGTLNYLIIICIAVIVK